MMVLGVYDICKGCEFSFSYFPNIYFFSFSTGMISPSTIIAASFKLLQISPHETCFTSPPRSRPVGGIRYAATAPTGVAAINIDGTTLHSWTGIGTPALLLVVRWCPPIGRSFQKISPNCLKFFCCAFLLNRTSVNFPGQEHHLVTHSR